jgi:hypothetical protein
LYQNDVKELWLKEHTLECTVYTARISLKQCEFFRSLPTEKDEPTIFTRIKHKQNIYNTKVRDIACDSCSTWKAKKADPEGYNQGNQENVK